MSNNPFKPASKKQAKLRMALVGTSGSGKTYTALKVATALVPGGKIAVIDTERGSASKYADQFKFDVVELSNYAPDHYIAMLNAAQANGYDVIIIDSLTHAWSGVGGVLEIVDNEAARSKSQNSYAAWRKGTPAQNSLIDAILGTNAHIIATMRSKTEYVLETNSNGKQAPRKVGMAPVQRDGMEYEFDIVAEMDTDNTLMITKTRCSAMNGLVINKPGADVAEKLRTWLTDGAPTEPPVPVPAQQPVSAPVTVTPAEVEKTMLDAGAHQRGATEPHVTLHEAVANYQQMYGDSTDAETIVEPAPTPVDEWWLDDARWNRLVNNAVAQLWNASEANYAHERIAVALGLESWEKRHEFAGCTVQEAWDYVKAFRPGGPRLGDKPAQTEPDSDDMAEDGTTAADTGEAWTPETNPLLEVAPVVPAEPQKLPEPAPVEAPAEEQPLSGPCSGTCGKETIKRDIFDRRWICEDCARVEAQKLIEQGRKQASELKKSTGKKSA